MNDSIRKLSGLIDSLLEISILENHDNLETKYNEDIFYAYDTKEQRARARD